MLDLSPAALSVVQSDFTADFRAEVWLGGELLADNVPLDDGSEERDRSLSVPETITLDVPRFDGGTDWTPVSPTDPLFAAGQIMRVLYGVEVGGNWEWIERGWFPITDSDYDDDSVKLTLKGMLTLIDEAKLPATFQPATALTNTVRSLLEPAVNVGFDPSLIDRTVPSGIQWDNDRLSALGEILTAWPAAIRVLQNGTALVEPATPSDLTPVLNLTDGVGGTVIRWESTSTRDGAFNMVVAQGTDSNGNQLTGVAYDTNELSPYRYGGPFNPLPVPFFYASDLLTTVAQCRAAAQTRLTTLRRQASRTLTATTLPHPGIETGDFVTVTGAGLVNALCTVEAFTLPYKPAEMTLTLRQWIGG